jgi:hypothetical protein
MEVRGGMIKVSEEKARVSKTLVMADCKGEKVGSNRHLRSAAVQATANERQAATI